MEGKDAEAAAVLFHLNARSLFLHVPNIPLDSGMAVACMYKYHKHILCIQLRISLSMKLDTLGHNLEIDS